jgi:hypothetical protein
MNSFIEVPASNLSISQRKPIFGVGINDATYLVKPLVEGKQQTCKYYQTWVGMLERCYSPKLHNKHPTYSGCTTSMAWLRFSNFRKWMETQDWEGNHLDKDLLVQGNKVYSPETCLFVSRGLNNLLYTCPVNRGLYKQGVSWNPRHNKFSASHGVQGKKKHLGFFKTEEEASLTYRTFKYNHIIAIAQEQTNQQLKEALLRHASLYLDEVLQ